MERNCLLDSIRDGREYLVRTTTSYCTAAEGQPQLRIWITMAYDIKLGASVYILLQAITEDSFTKILEIRDLIDGRKSLESYDVS